MRRAKGIFLGTILLLVSIAAASNAVSIHENTQTQSAYTNQDNSLGMLNVTHYPFFYQPTYRGARINYYPPGNNYTYSFKEINGTVLMNFTLTVRHQLYHKIFDFIIKPRHTLIDKLLIAKGSPYFNVFNATVCTSDTWEEYTIYLTEEMQMQPLETNGNETIIYFTLNAGVGAGNGKPQSDGTIWFIGRGYSNRIPENASGVPVSGVPLNIVPIPDP